MERQDDIPNNEFDLPKLSLWQRIRNKLDLSGDELIGYSLLISCQLFNSFMITACKLLITDKDSETPIHPIQILFVRMFMTYILCIIYMMIFRKSVPDAPFGKPEVRKWLVLRGIVGFMGVFGLYFSLLYLSLSDAVAITFLVPLVTAFLAFVVLHERYSIVEGICSIISLGGVILIAKPHFIFGKEADNESNVDDSIESSSTEKRLLASGVGLLGVMGASLVYIVIRKIGKDTHALISVSYYASTVTVVSFICILVIPSISFAIPQNAYQWFLFITIGISGFLFQFALTSGIQRVKAGKASLVVYTQVIFAIFWDVVIWNHFPGILSLLGILVILTCTAIVIKYKPEEKPQDIELGQHQPLSQDGYKPEDIQLQDFVIGDDEDEDNQKPHELVSSDTK